MITLHIKCKKNNAHISALKIHIKHYEKHEVVFGESEIELLKKENMLLEEAVKLLIKCNNIKSSRLENLGYIDL